MKDELELHRQKIKKGVAKLEEVFARALIGDYSKDLPTPTEDDELAPVFVGVNVMIGSIREQIAKYQGLNSSLEKEIAKSTADLRRRGLVLEAVNFAASQFLADRDWQTSVNKVLKRLGEAVDVSRVYIFEVEDSEKIIISQRFEWVAKGVQPQINNSDLMHIEFSKAGFGRWTKLLMAGKVISGHVRQMPASERRLLEAQDIKSILVIPIFVNNKWWGFIGFDEIRELRQWTDNEVAALQTAANLLGIAQNRYITEQEAIRRSHELEVLNRGMIGRELKMAELKQEIKRLKGAVS